MNNNEVRTLVQKYGWQWVCQNINLSEDNITANFDTLTHWDKNCLIKYNCLNNNLIETFYDEFTIMQREDILYTYGTILSDELYDKIRSEKIYEDA